MEHSNLLTFLIAAVAYAGGIVTGVYIRILLEKKHKEFDAPLFVMIAVTIVWIISVLYDMADPGYETHMLIHGIMGSIVGVLLKTQTTKKGK